MKSTEFLQSAIDVQKERGEQYDKPSGERSMGATVRAFNAITGHVLEESDGWMLLGLLKLVRQAQNPEKYHHDSALDFVAYASLYAEAASEQCGQLEEKELNDWKNWKEGDIVESMEEVTDIDIGKHYILTADPSASGDLYIRDSGGDLRNRKVEEYRFVSRPTSTAK